MQSIITFGSLRGAGHLAEGQNLLFQHTLQATTMVGGHHLTAAIGITPRPEGTLGEQLLSAEVTNLQLMAEWASCTASVEAAWPPSSKGWI